MRQRRGSLRDPFANSLLKWLQEQGLGQARAHRHHPSLPHGRRGPSIEDISYCSPRSIMPRMGYEEQLIRNAGSPRSIKQRVGYDEQLIPNVSVAGNGLTCCPMAIAPAAPLIWFLIDCLAHIYVEAPFSAEEHSYLTKTWFLFIRIYNKFLFINSS